MTDYTKSTVIIGGFKQAVKNVNLTVLSFRQVFFANLNVLTAARQRRANDSQNYFGIWYRILHISFLLYRGHF